jgi:hypothetical protein
MTGQETAADRITLGTTLYSLTNEFHQRKFDFAGLVREVAKRGLGPGLEVVGFQSIRGFPDVSDDDAKRFHDLIAETGLTPTCLSINADLRIKPDYDRSPAELLAYHARQLRTAAKLGFPIVRYQYAAGPEVIRQLLPLAETLGVKMGLEIHAPHTVEHPEVLAYREMYAQMNSPLLGFIPDFGSSARALPERYLNYHRRKGMPERAIDYAKELWAEESDPFKKRPRYLEWAEKNGIERTMAVDLYTIYGLFSRQPAENWRQIMPQVIHMHGKFYEIDATGSEPSIDYAAHMRPFIEGGYRGSISSEWEAHQVTDDPGFPEIERHHAMLKRLLSGSSAAAA